LAQSENEEGRMGCTVMFRYNNHGFMSSESVYQYWKKIAPSKYTADGNSESLSSNIKTILLSFVI
jgi:hypothetical protein